MDVRLLHPVTHDGKECGRGTVLTLDDQAGNRLIRLGVALDAKARNDDPPDPLDPPASESEKKDISAMTKAELAADLSARGITFKQTDNKDVLIGLLKDALAEEAEGENGDGGA